MRVVGMRSQFLLPNYSNVDLQFASVNVFIGPNNSGKTKLLELLHDCVCRAIGRGESQASTAANQATAQQRPLEVRYDFGPRDEPNDQYDGGYVSFGTTVVRNPNLYRCKLLQVPRQPLSTFDTRESDEVKPRASQSLNTEDMFAELATDRKLRVVLNYEINKLFGVDLSIEDIGYNIRVRTRTSAGSRINVDSEGRGLQDYLVMFFYLHHPAYNFVFIDEPESSLHPQLQRVFLRRLKDLASEHNKQVFITSHSPFMVLPSSVDDLHGVFILRPRDPSPQIVPLSSLIPIDQEGRRRFESYLPNVDAAVAELFFARGALVVEGPTDRQLIKFLAAKTNEDPHEADISIIDASGLALMPGLIRIAKRLTPNWQGIADADLLRDSRPVFVKYRDDMADALGIDQIPQTDDENVRDQLLAAGLHVLPEKGIETLYRSPAALEYTDLNNVEGRDKGWLLEREIEYARGLTTEQIRQQYGDILHPLGEVRRLVSESEPALPSLSRMMQDSLQDEGLEIHRLVFRNQLSEANIRSSNELRDLIASYDLAYASHDDYVLTPKGIRGIRIRCKGKVVSIVCEGDDRCEQVVLSAEV